MRQPNSDVNSNRFDSSRFDNLPDFSLPEVSWMAGVAEEAMKRYLEEANAALLDGTISMANLLRATFTLLGRKENQSAMLRLQLSTTLERERELSETLRAGLLGTGLPTVPISPKVVQEKTAISTPPKVIQDKKTPSRKKKKK